MEDKTSTAVDQHCKNAMCQKILGSVVYYVGSNGPYCESCFLITSKKYSMVDENGCRV